jgi:hypothetical protein
VPGKFKAKALAVASETLSEMLTDAEMAATRLIKIDVEGAEARVIKGLAPKLALLPKDAEVVIEISADSMENSKFSSIRSTLTAFMRMNLRTTTTRFHTLYPHAPRGAERLSAIPSKQTDVIFSRFDVECL